MICTTSDLSPKSSNIFSATVAQSASTLEEADTTRPPWRQFIHSRHAKVKFLDPKLKPRINTECDFEKLLWKFIDDLLEAEIEELQAKIQEEVDLEVAHL